MKRMLMLAFCGLFCLGAGPVPTDNANLEQQARSATQEFMTALKGQLGDALKSGGPAHAITVCSEVAPRIASRISRERGWAVGRTSLRLRSPVNLAKPWEWEVLRDFEEKAKAGDDLATLEYAAVVKVAGGERFRYMKAIPTQEACLLCHGANPAADVQKKLAVDYPYDQATGFALGDLRGAFTIEIPLPGAD